MTQTVPDISPLMPMHQDPLLVKTHWGRVMHIWVSKLAIIGTDNWLVAWTNAGISLSGTRWTNVSEIFSEIHTFYLEKMHLNMSSVKYRHFCLGLNVLIIWHILVHLYHLFIDIPLCQCHGRNPGHHGKKHYTDHITARTMGILFGICFTQLGNTFSTLRPRQNGRHFPDDIFQRIFLNENVRILIKISL